VHLAAAEFSLSAADAQIGYEESQEGTNQGTQEIDSKGFANLS